MQLYCYDMMLISCHKCLEVDRLSLLWLYVFSVSVYIQDQDGLEYMIVRSLYVWIFITEIINRAEISRTYNYFDNRLIIPVIFWSNKYKTLLGFSFSAANLQLFHFLHVLVYWISLGFGLLVRQIKQSEDITVGSEKLWMSFLTFYEQN